MPVSISAQRTLQVLIDNADHGLCTVNVDYMDKPDAVSVTGIGINMPVACNHYFDHKGRPLVNSEQAETAARLTHQLLTEALDNSQSVMDSTPAVARSAQEQIILKTACQILGKTQTHRLPR